jgi:hypothetical protein
MSAHGQARRSGHPVAVRSVFGAAGASYLASCAVGVGVASGALDLRGARWVHHALYITTVTLAGVAASSLVWSQSRAGWSLLPAAVPLAALARLGPRLPRHPIIALAGLVNSRK